MHPIYRGVPRQNGRGLGAMFKSAIATMTPLLKPVLKTGLNALKEQGAKQGLAAAHDILVGGKNPKDVIFRRGAQTLKTVGSKVLAAVGTKRKKSNTPRQSTGKRRRVNTSKRKSRPLDIFD